MKDQILALSEKLSSITRVFIRKQCLHVDEPPCIGLEIFLDLKSFEADTSTSREIETAVCGRGNKKYALYCNKFSLSRKNFRTNLVLRWLSHTVYAILYGFSDMR